jgi:hypothetical protein
VSSNRREFLYGAPAGWLGLNLFSGEAMEAAQQQTPAVSHDVVSFWVNQMGIDPSSIVGGASVAGNRDITAGEVDPAVQREPAFYHVDNTDFALVAGHKIDSKKLIPSGDVKVSFNLARLRLNATDTETFKKFTSGGIYLDMGQNAATTPDLTTGVATSFFSALLPNLSSFMGGKGSGKGSGKSAKGKGGAGAGAKSAGAKSPAGAPGAPSGGAPPAGGSIPLQKPSQNQALTLTKGAGSTAFSCFAKDAKKSIFGQVVSALFSDQTASMIPILNLPVIGSAALAGIRTLVANFQAHGGDNQWILRSGPMDVVATQDSLSATSPESLRIPNGVDQYYIAVPKGQVAALADKMSGFRMYDGFLIPKDAKDEEAYVAAPETVPEITYLSLKTTTSVVKSKG